MLDFPFGLNLAGIGDFASSAWNLKMKSAISSGCSIGRVSDIKYRPPMLISFIMARFETKFFEPCSHAPYSNWKDL
jgi:hypothetical protein